MKKRRRTLSKPTDRAEAERAGAEAGRVNAEMERIRAEAEHAGAEVGRARAEAREGDDAWLVRQAKRSGEAFGELYEKYVERVYRFFFRRVDHEKELAEDLTQDVFVRAWQHVSRFTDRGISYSAYLMKIAKHLLVDHYTSAKNRKTHIDIDEVEEVVPDPQSDLERIVDGALIRNVLNDLNPREREAATLFYLEGQSVRAVAARLRKSENAVKIILHRVRKTLAEHPRVLAERPGGFSLRRLANKVFRSSKERDE